MSEKSCLNIIIVIAIALFLLWWLSKPRQIRIEPFITDPSPELNRYYEGGTAGIKDLLIDRMKCDPSCCGDMRADFYGEMNPLELQQALASSMTGDGGPYVRTNYQCANGVGGTGCPCITPKAYLNLANRGLPEPTYPGEINPTFWVGADVAQKELEYPPVPARIRSQDGKSIFVPSPKINDLQLQRAPEPVTNVQRAPARLQ